MTFAPRLALCALAAFAAACGGPADQAPPPPRVPVAPPEGFQAIDLAPGREEARKCLLCHTIAENAPHSIGPNLHHMFGATVGTAPGYAFSPALISADFVWTAEALENWLTDPMGFLPGTRMTFPGVYDPDLRRSLIAYLYERTGGSAAETEAADAPD